MNPNTRTIARAEGGGYLLVSVDAVHDYDCPFWRMGKKHGPCVCGACALEEQAGGFEAALRTALKAKS